MVSAQVAAANWKSGMAGAGQKMQAGVDAVQEAPSQAAIRAIPRYLEGVNRAVSDGKLERGLNRVSLQDWKTAMKTKGIQRIASGAAAAEGKMASFLAEFLPYQEQGVQALKSMPRGDLQQNIQRAVFMMEHAAKFVRSR